MLINPACHFCFVAAAGMQVVEQGLTPDMAIRACNNETITNSTLSREISKAVDERARKEVELIREKEKSSKTGSSSAVSSEESTPPGSESSSSSKRRRTSKETAVSGGTPSSASSATAARKQKQPKRISPCLGGTPLTAPYLKGNPTHFQRKVKAKVDTLISEVSPSPEKVAKTAVTLKSKKTSLQKNRQWRNEKSHKEDTSTRYKDAFKEATEIFDKLRKGLIENPKTQQQYLDQLNRKYQLDGQGQEGSREKKKLTITTVYRAVRNGTVGSSPKKKGRNATISRDFLKLVALHVNMEQVGPRGELDSAAIHAVMLAATLGTVHEDRYNQKYAWETCRRENADILIPTGVVQSEDIRWMWVTWEKLNQWFTDYRVRSIFYLFVFVLILILISIYSHSICLYDYWYL